MTITGEIKCSGKVILDGRIDGTFCGADLVVGSGGHIGGNVQADSIDCSGELEGHIVATQLSLQASARHSGVAEVKELKIEPGAILDCILQAGTGGTVASRVVEQQPAALQLDLKKVLGCYDDMRRPCCMDVPWSERQELFSNIMELLAKGKALIKVQGESGSGKSELYRKLQNDLPDLFNVVTINDPVGSVSFLLQQVAGSLGLELDSQLSQPELVARIGETAEAIKKSGRRIVWLIDDVQQMYPASLEGVIHILANAFGDGEGMMQIIILGDDEMQSTLVATVLEYFEDETNCQLELAPMSIKDTAEYLRFALQLRGGDEGAGYVSLFPYETIRMIHLKSGGNIAKINELAGRAIQNCLKAGKFEVSPEML